MKYIFTSEAVTEGHPDKVADRIADSILDELIKQDANSRVACEVVTSTNLVFIFGQITSQAHVNYEQIARDTVKEIGYNAFFNCKSLEKIVYAGKKEQWRKIKRGSNWLNKAGTTIVSCLDGAIQVNPYRK